MSKTDAIRQFAQNTGADTYDILIGLGDTQVRQMNALNREGQELLYGSAFTYTGNDDPSYSSIMQNERPNSADMNDLAINYTGLSSGYNPTSSISQTGFTNDFSTTKLNIYNTGITTSSSTQTYNSNDTGIVQDQTNSSSGKYTFRTTVESSGKKTNTYYIDGKPTDLVTWRKNAPKSEFDKAQKAIS